jgi:hypothetical protein
MYLSITMWYPDLPNKSRYGPSWGLRVVGHKPPTPIRTMDHSSIITPKKTIFHAWIEKRNGK